MCVVKLAEDCMEEVGMFRRFGAYRFVQGRGPYEPTTALKHLGQHASKYQHDDDQVHVALADVYQAFDHCTVANFSSAMAYCTIPYVIQRAMIEPL
eukprot:2723517-Pyramimonas_sp.AAC.1